MNDLRVRTLSDLVAGLNAGQHLAVDAVVAFVDGELGPGAYERAAAHLTTCRMCASEVAAQRQAASVIRSAGYPEVPADLLTALRDIPRTADLPSSPDGLAVAGDGTLVTLADPGPAPPAPRPDVPRPGTARFGSGPRWGTGPSVLGGPAGRSLLGRSLLGRSLLGRSLLGRSALGRRAGRTGAGAVVSGLVLGALIMTLLEDPDTETAGPQPEEAAPTSAVPFVMPATVRMAEPGAEASGHTVPMTIQPGWHGAELPR